MQTRAHVPTPCTHLHARAHMQPHTHADNCRHDSQALAHAHAQTGTYIHTQQTHTSMTRTHAHAHVGLAQDLHTSSLISNRRACR